MLRLPEEKILNMFKWLLKLRLLEERMIELALAGLVPGWIHSYMGQEAIPVGVISNLRKEDYITGTHRSRGHSLLKGMDLKRYVAEILGRKNGVCQGRGGEIHLADKQVGVMASSGIVGGILSTALGLAFASQYLGDGRVTVAFFGEGSTNQGTFHECLNLASVWKLPIVFVCENNSWSEFSPQNITMRIENISERAAAYVIPGITIDGDDVLAVYEAAAKAVRRTREGEGPILMECKTHRWLGHYVGDPQKYRPPEDLESARQFDPIARFQGKLLQEGVLTESILREMEEELRKEIDEAIEFGKNSPMPDPRELAEFVYCEDGGRR
ncbi:thiamine pyrophosphate-dependent dehydrogenase E1 component subunit alpha [Chloroflexota bacterium]